MNPLRLVIAVLALVGVIGTFLPWLVIPFLGTVNGTAGNGPGWITLGLFVASAIAILATRPARAVDTLAALSSGIPALCASLYAIYTLLDLQAQFADIGASNSFAEALVGSVSVGVGVYLVIAMGIVVASACGGAFLWDLRARRTNPQGGAPHP